MLATTVESQMSPQPKQRVCHTHAGFCAAKDIRLPACGNALHGACVACLTRFDVRTQQGTPVVQEKVHTQARQLPDPQW